MNNLQFQNNAADFDKIKGVYNYDGLTSNFPFAISS